MKFGVPALLITSFVSAHAAVLSGGLFSLNGEVGAGGVAAGGNFQVQAVAGRPPAGTSTGGNITLHSGALNLFTVPFGDWELEIRTDVQGQVTLTWPVEASAYQLESTAELGSGALWQPVTPAPVGNSFTTGVAGTARFFRLHRSQ